MNASARQTNGWNSTPDCGTQLLNEKEPERTNIIAEIESWIAARVASFE